MMQWARSGWKAAIVAGTTALAAVWVVPAQAEPAMWSISDADSIIYLFGTAHAVRKDTAWKTPKIDAAMRASTDLWLEIDDDLVANQTAMAAIVRRYGIDPARPLSKALTPAQLARLVTTVKPYGMTLAQLEPMRPWLAAVTVSGLPLAKAGLDAGAGADRTLRGIGVAEGDGIHGLETAEQQIRFLADFSEADQVSFLTDTLQDVAEGPKQIADLSTAWEKGDVKALSRIVVDDMRRDAPKLYQRLIVQRNIAWAQQIRTMLAGKGTAFVAVGVGHLVGPDSVQAQLARAGIPARRR